jgi:mono/diheme cytochrome c family protein
MKLILTSIAVAATLAATAVRYAPQMSLHGAQGAEATAAEITLGDSIFHGKAGGGICFTCHQNNAKGLPGLAPDLTDQKWIHGDGSMAFLVAIIEKGVPKPKEAAAPMVPFGGAKLTPAQVRAVAAYVYSLRTRK